MKGGDSSRQTSDKLHRSCGTGWELGTTHKKRRTVADVLSYLAEHLTGEGVGYVRGTPVPFLDRRGSTGVGSTTKVYD